MIHWDDWVQDDCNDTREDDIKRLLNNRQFLNVVFYTSTKTILSKNYQYNLFIGSGYMSTTSLSYYIVIITQSSQCIMN